MSIFILGRWKEPLNHTLDILPNNSINLLPRNPLNSLLNPLLPINKINPPLRISSSKQKIRHNRHILSRNTPPPLRRDSQLDLPRRRLVSQKPRTQINSLERLGWSRLALPLCSQCCHVFVGFLLGLSVCRKHFRVHLYYARPFVVGHPARLLASTAEV